MHFRRLTSIAVAAASGLAALAVSTSPAAAATVTCSRYAAPSGADTAAGTAAAPLRTAQKLAASLKPGETGCLRAGEYKDEVDGPYVLRISKGGTATAPITIRSAPGERALLHGIVFVTDTADHVRISDVNVDGRRPVVADPPVSIQIMGDDVRIERSDITNHNARSCMILGSESGWGRAKGTLVSDNTFHDCGDPVHGMLDHAIYLNAVDDAHITKNLFLRSAAFAIHFYPDAQRTLVDHNVMADNGGGVIFAGHDNMAASDNIVEKNVITGSLKRPGLQSYWGNAVGHGNIARSNCLYNPIKGNVDMESGGYTTSANIVTAPLFSDVAHGDYRLKSLGCLTAVGYDTAAALAGVVAAITPTPTPTPAPTATPVPTTAPVVSTTTAPTAQPTTTSPASSTPSNPTTTSPASSTPSRPTSTTPTIKKAKKKTRTARAAAKKKAALARAARRHCATVARTASSSAHSRKAIATRCLAQARKTQSRRLRRA